MMAGNTSPLWFKTVLYLGLLAYGTTQECYSRPRCEGRSFAVVSARECCAETDEGVSFSADGTGCTIAQCIVHGFYHSSYNVTEGETLLTTFGPNVKGVSRFPALGFPGTITVVEDTATSTDYERLVNILTHSSGNTSVRFVPRDDEITLEYGDRVTLTYTPGHPLLLAAIEDAGEFIRQRATINIIDTDKLEVYFEETAYSVREEDTADTMPIIRVQFTKTTQSPFTLTVTPVSIDVAESLGIGDFIPGLVTARAKPGSDFTARNTTVTIPPTHGGTTNTFQLPHLFEIIDDTINEYAESFALVTEVGTDTPDGTVCFLREASDRTCHGRIGAAPIDILDNDVPMLIGFAQRTQTVSESSTPPGADGYYIRVRVNSIGSEIRDYPVRIRVTTANTTVEGINVQFGSTYDALFGTRINVYDPITEELTVAKGEFHTYSTAYIRQDFRSEGLECFSLLISGIDYPGFRDISSCNEDELHPTDYFCQHTVCIEDDDEPFVVAFVKTMYTVAECDGQVEVCVNLTRPHTDILDEVVHLDVYRSDSSRHFPSGSGLATPDFPNFLGTYTVAPGSDYEEHTPVTNGLRDSSITESSRVVCYNQTVYCDIRLELTEYFGLALSVRESSTVRAVVGPVYGQAAVKILDGNGTAKVSLENTVYHDEGDMLEVCAVIIHPEENCPIQFPFSVALSTSDGSDDLTINFTECEKRSCTNVNRASFPLSLGRTPDLDPRISLCSDIAQLFSVAVEFESEVYTVSENAGSVRVCAVIRGESAGEEVNIGLFTEEQTAKAETDFTHLELNSVIAKELCMSISIIDNYLPGPDVQFSVRASSKSHMIPSVQTTVIITDDEILNGCTYKVVNASLSEEETREEVVIEIAKALDSVLPITLGGAGSNTTLVDILGGDPLLSSNETSEEPPLKVVYTAIAEEFKVQTTEEGFKNFTEAVTQITEAKETACEGEHAVSEGDVARLGREYKKLRGDIEGNIDRIRGIFGAMLCLSERSQEVRRKKRQDSLCPEFGAPCSCPPEGEIICVCEFFACLDPADDIQPILGIVDVLVDEGFPCLAFAVDTTGSMRNAIEAVKVVIRDFLRSEEDGPGCYVLQPFNDLEDGRFNPASIPDATVATTYNGIDSVTELEQLRLATENLTANGGGDFPERQFRALLTILELTDSDGQPVMIPGSEIVLLTDAHSHDTDLEDDIITKARSMKVCISIISNRASWEPYDRIATQTGGIIVNSIHPDAILDFDEEHAYLQCANFYDLDNFGPPIIGKRKKRAATTSFSTEQRCHYFTTSSLASSLTIQGFTSQDTVIVTTPNSEEVRVIDNVRGEKLYRAADPPAGQWSVCVETGTLTISLDITDRVHSILKFLKSVEDSFSLRSSPPPPACTEDHVSIETAEISDIRNSSLQLVDDESGRVLTTTPLLRCANRLLGNVSFPQATVRYRVLGRDGSGRVFNSTLSPKSITFIQEEGAKFRVEAAGEGHMEVETGQSVTIPLTVSNFLPTDVHYSFTAEPVTGFRQAFRPTSLVVPPRGHSSLNWIIIPVSSTADGTMFSFTTSVTDGCVVHSITETVTYITPVTTPPPVTNECGCMNGGTCTIRIIRRRRILRCVCPTGHSGFHCEI